MMGQESQTEFRKEKAQLQSTQISRDDFVRKYTACKQRVGGALAADGKGGGRKGARGPGRKGKGRGRIDARPPLEVPAGHIGQGAAKLLLPPGASIWRNLVRGGWPSRYPPYPRSSADWGRYGEREALLMNLRSVWSTYLEHQGLDRSHCRINGLFG